MRYSLGNELLEDIRKIIELPKNVIEMTIHMAIDEAAEVECKFYPRREIDTTTLDSSAREYTFEKSGPLVTKRYRLEQIAEPVRFNFAQPHQMRP